MISDRTIRRCEHLLHNSNLTHRQIADALKLTMWMVKRISGGIEKDRERLRLLAKRRYRDQMSPAPYDLTIERAREQARGKVFAEHSPRIELELDDDQMARLVEARAMTLARKRAEVETGVPV